MKKNLLLIGMLFTGIAAFANSEQLKLKESTRNQVKSSLSLPEFDALAECILNYSRIDKDSLESLSTSGAKVCDCIAFEFGFNQEQKAEMKQAIQSFNAVQTNINPDVYLDELVLILSDNIQRKLNGEVPASQSISTVTAKDKLEQQFNILLAIIGVIIIGFLMLCIYVFRKVKELKKTSTSFAELGAKTSLEQRISVLEDGSNNLKLSLEKIAGLKDLVEAHTAEIEMIAKKIADTQSGGTQSGGTQGGTTISTVINTPNPVPKTSVLYTSAPLNGLFIKILDQFIPRSTFYQIEINSQRNNMGEFTLVNNADTQQIAFNIPDTYLPNEACEIRNSGGPISTQRKWKILSKGQVERQNAAWKIIKPMIIQFE